MFAMAMVTFREALRKKIFLIISILTVIYMVVLTLLIYFMMKEMKSIAADAFVLVRNVSGFVAILGFYFSSMAVAFLSIMSSVGAVSTEIENGTLQAVIAKPVRRSQYIAGKILGLSALSAAYAVFLYLFLIILNKALDVPPINTINIWRFFAGLLFFVLEPLALVAFSVFGSIIFKTVSNGIMVIGVYILGLIGAVFEWIGKPLNSVTLTDIGIVISLLSPFDTIYRKTVSTVFTSELLAITPLTPYSASGGEPSAIMMAYAFLYAVLFVFLAVRRFNRRDI